jgi:sugar lactone lactonase YvrE
MKSRFYSTWRATLAAALTLIATRAIASPFQAGDIVYTDSFGAVFSLNPVTRAGAIVASGGKLIQPFGIVLDANRNVYVSDTWARAIIRIDAVTGAQTVVATGAKLGTPFGIAVDSRGDILVANGQAILRLNALAGQPAVVSAHGRFGGSGGSPLVVAVAGNGDLIVANVGVASEIVRVNPRNGFQSLISNGGYLKRPAGIAINGNDIYVTDVATPDGNFGVGTVIRVDMATGAQTLVSSDGHLVGPVGIAVDENGQLVVGDPYTINQASPDLYDGAIIRINPADGGQTLLLRGQGNYVNPRGIAVVRAAPVGR